MPAKSPNKTARQSKTTFSELPKAYEPAKYERDMYQMWLDGGYFQGVVDKNKTPYAIAMPPPNATGRLHLGHATAGTIEDILIRFERMRGKATVFIPGTDHAAIATNALVEKALAEKEGKTKHDLGRAEYLKRVKAFVADSQKNIREQIRRLGVSCDWSRERYTMDEQMSLAVNEAFVRMYDAGLIYRGKRIISWCPQCASSLSDIEVEYEEVPGSLWYIKYPVVEDGKWTLDRSVMVATTRPETMLGDMAVAVHPDDTRYKDLIGKHVLLPLAEREIPIVADKHVDPNFGTGALKITPAHDMADYEVAQRHQLQALNVIGESGRMTKDAKDFSGMDIDQARDAVVLRLQELGFLDHIEEYKHNKPSCSRCDTRVEPLVSDQWFVKVESLAKKAIDVVRDGKITLAPDYFTKVYLDWMENLHDWNISRQLWWGHRIPVFTCSKCKHQFAATDAPKKCPKCDEAKLVQDPDTLDTWFSSGLWTFATLGWPKKTPELDFWHPTAVMESGRDILFLWVTRMIMLSLYLQNEIPFAQVYLHGLVIDEHGQKMSKSKGNGIDPLDMADKYGMDAVRLSLVSGVAAGQDNRVYEKKIEGFRNFVNKLWNVSRFITTTTECKKSCEHLEELALDDLALEDRWILHQLTTTTAAMTDALEKFRFSDAAQSLYKFLWDDFADWYIEIAKLKPSQTKKDILILVLEQILKLAHPFTPFVTEAIWQSLQPDGERPLIVSQWPIAADTLVNVTAGADFKKLQELIIGLRQLRADYRIPTGTIITVVLPRDPLLKEHAATIEKLARVSISDSVTLANAMTRTIAGSVIAAQVAEHVHAKKEHKRVTKELETTEKVLSGLSGRLKNPIFITKAPQKVVEKERARQQELEKKVAALKSMLEELSQLQ